MFVRKNIINDFLLAAVIFILALVVITMTSCKHEPAISPADPLTNNQNGGGNNNGNGNGSGNTGQENEEVVICDPDTAYFQTQVLPLLVSNCAKSGCHDAASHKDGVVLDSYSNVMSTGDIDPGRPDHSEVYEMITESDEDDRMPPEPLPRLSNDQISLINRWIDQGALNNGCVPTTCDTTIVTFAAIVQPILQNSCVGCHSGSSPSGGISFASHSGVAAVANNGKLLGAITHSPGFTPMPQGGNQLSNCKIAQIRIWIQEGALNN